MTRLARPSGSRRSHLAEASCTGCCTSGRKQPGEHAVRLLLVREPAERWSSAPAGDGMAVWATLPVN